MRNLFSISVLVLWTLGAVAQSVTIRPNVVSNPRLTYDAIAALPNPQEGDTVYDLTFKCLRVYTGSKWVCTFQNPADPTPNMAAIASAGGTSFDAGQSITTDASGNVYVTGYFQSTASFAGTNITSPAGLADIFIAKYNSSGILQWVRSAGGALYDYGEGIATDASGNVYVTGRYQGTATFGNTTITSAGSSDVFVAKYNTSGTLLWVRSGGGGGGDSSSDITVDVSGNVYVTGHFEGLASFSNNFLISSKGYDDIFVTKYNSSGTAQWVRSAGGVSSDQGNDIATDALGNIYVIGDYEDTANFAGTTITSEGKTDIFIAKYNSGGALQWVRSAGGISFDGGNGIATDVSGNIYVTGWYSDQASYGGRLIRSVDDGVDIYVAKYNSSGTLLWVRTAGGGSSDRGNSITTDASGNVYVTGYFQSTASFTGTTITSVGETDIFIAKYLSNSAVQWVLSAGGVYSDEGLCIATDASENVYLGGGYRDIVSFRLTTIVSLESSYDIFVARVRQW